ncbi:MAG: hypothetical protein HOM14_08740 [Gammaproteobacteria bacterium]|jgi:coenzyme F420-reducing hydrogenase alpha subunit|nr:hypothetical protein [Gammaproteobacteria bacterium]MBT3725930.1 hypothetical protein [Gammaproteobacteria bacterium]MBT4078890.1 hypothetical protein [Gammaproteobacteria bacterium]MBT4195869.1 hypothetical protein [Gammaproteobacteria bacterium]MBT4448977.1 hypothetical protein [Gammaproteobacteria bacterium]
MNTNTIEGQIEIDLYPHEKSGSRVEIHSSRPVNVSKVMIGKNIENALSLIPLIYNICSVAQARTSLKAIQQNLNLEIHPVMETARDMLVLAESAREHLFRIFVDWPKLFAMNTEVTVPPSSAQKLNEFKQALFKDGKAFSLDSKLRSEITRLQTLIKELEQDLQQKVFGVPCNSWLTINDLDGLNHWITECDSIAARSVSFIINNNWSSEGFSDCLHLPELNPEELIKRFNANNAEEFIAQPDWKGCLYETTSLTRQQQHPLVQQLILQFNNTLITRWVARLIELASIPQQLQNLLDQLETVNNIPQLKAASTTGLAQTEAARGRLIHHVQIQQQKISNYQILAPTEWNFHPQGLIAKSLTNLTPKHPEQLDQLARLVINAIDPCVGYSLRIHT